MPTLVDMFPGYDSVVVPTEAGRISARVHGSGEPVLLLHGHPQTGVMWHRVAPLLDSTHTLVIPDLPGYGASEAPAPAFDHAPYDKRSMALAMIELMRSLGHEQFAVVGHDRGGRVAYRLALDSPESVTRLALLDIVSTLDMWENWAPETSRSTYHWTMLAAPEPIPELLLEHSAADWVDATMGLNTRGDARDLSAFDPNAMEHYRDFLQQPDRIHAICEDYRAGATVDLRHDRADLDAGRTITAPLLVIWGDRGIPASGHGLTPVDTWRKWAPDVIGQALPCAHFIAEEAPAATAQLLVDFFALE